MSDDRTSAAGTGSAGEVHDDDELADAIAAEIERYATGAVPVIGAAAQARPVATPAPDAQDPVARPGRRRAADPDETAGAPRQPAPRRPEPQPGPRPGAWTISTDELPVVRRSGYREPVRPPRPRPDEPIAPLERVLPTGPIELPEPTASLLDEMAGDRATPQAARHAAPVPLDGPGPELEDALRTTGSLHLPPGLYEDWEQSLRAIGRPRAIDDVEDVAVPGGSVDTATVALRVPVAPTPVVAPPASFEPRPAAAPADTPPPSAPEPRTVAVPAPAPERLLPRRARRRAADSGESVEASAVVAAPAVPAEQEEQDGVDDLVGVAPEPRPASAVTTGPEVVVPPRASVSTSERAPRTAPVFVERMRTAILELRAVPARPTGSRPAAVVARWLGAFASPVTLLVGFAVAGAAPGPLAAVAVLVGVLLALPAVARASAWSVRDREDGDRLERTVLGRRAGAVAAGVLLLARLAAAALALAAVGALVGAFETRTGALPGTGTGVQVVAVVAAGVIALAVGTWSDRVTGVLLLVLAAVGTVVVLFLAAVLLPGTPAPGTSGGTGLPAAVGAGFAAVGLLLVLAGPDLVRLRTAIPRPRGVAVAGGVAGLVGGVLLVVGVAAGARAGAEGVSEDALAGALGDATAALLAAPLVVALLAGSLALPALVVRSAGAAAARLIGDGRSVRLGAVSAGLLAVAGALGLVASGLDVSGAALVVAAVLGVPVAAWAGVLSTAPMRGGRSVLAVVTASTATVLGWVLADSLLPGWSSPVLDAAGLAASSGWRGGPVVGLLAAFVLSAVGGLLARQRDGQEPPRRDPADSVEG